jgi:hypothetical protein
MTWAVGSAIGDASVARAASAAAALAVDLSGQPAQNHRCCELRSASRFPVVLRARHVHTSGTAPDWPCTSTGWHGQQISKSTGMPCWLSLCTASKDVLQLQCNGPNPIDSEEAAWQERIGLVVGVPVGFWLVVAATVHQDV